MIEFAVTFSPGAELEVEFAENVPLDVDMGQVMEVLATEERTVELSMPSGNQVILPTSSKGMRKVTIQKPDTLLSENIKKDVVIGGVTGVLEAPPTGPYIEYTSLDSFGRVFTAKFRGTVVPEYAFAYLAELISVDMPDNVIAISDNGFYRCQKLSLTSLPSGITSLGDYAFADCSMLALTSLPSGITSIGDYVFRNCTSLASITLPPALTTIGNYAFSNCTGLKTVRFTSTVSSIPNGVFSGCTKLSTIYVPWSQGEVANAPWGANNATIIYDYTEN
nr:MAG TPA: leucine-rich repeat protein [Caudoviricetes sp.]